MFASIRTRFLAGFVVCAALMAYALYAQWQLLLTPCPLCIFQRIGVIAMGVVFLIGALHGPRRWGRWVYAVLVLLAGIWGAVAAARQLWLQSLDPAVVPSCAPGLGYLFDTQGWFSTLGTVFAGSGDCAEVHWHFLGLTMPGWTLIWFVLLMAWGVFSAARRRT